MGAVTLSGPQFLGPQAAVMILPIGIRVARLCQDVPKSPAGAPRSLSWSWTQSGGGHCRGVTVLVHPFPSNLYTHWLLTPFCFLSSTLGWEEPGLSFSWVPSLGKPSTEQASDQSLCKECSLRLLDRPLSSSLSDTTLCSLRSPPYLVISAWSRAEPQCLTPSHSLGDAEQVVTPILWTAACWAHLGAQGKVPLLHGEKRYQSHPCAGPLRVGANQTKVLMSRS